VIKPVLALCGREEVLPEVSQLSLTHRAPRGRHGLPYSHSTVHGSETWQANGHTFTHTFSANFKDLTVVDEGNTLRGLSISLPPGIRS